ncbi:hypothetical protein MLD38_020500 [Melastoma candidum]|uniref:Uncharacterized protein n=1 Tax=Melastoma candidum TaxID=119954 RepID=A0ACB9QEC4_9MYRT|nr:hypothetical protein MLD38_020500 [Melastoma candidum]
MNRNFQAVLAAAIGFVVVSLVVSLVLHVCRRTRRCSKPPLPTRAVRSVECSRMASAGDETTEFDRSESFDPSLMISMSDLVDATSNFSPDLIVGDGGFGLVYRARLRNGLTVAIKRLEPLAFQGFREFRAEMETLARLHHPNIVKILGYCISRNERLLVYEFIERGSLDQWLYDGRDKSALDWDTRVRIVKGVGCGLAYMHSLPTPIIHRDIKASNVLLDGGFAPHIADFGLARRIESSHSHVSTQFAGTVGYMPPEYKEGFTAATLNADVYSFGILMIEIMTGKRPNLPVLDPSSGKEVGLIVWVKNMVAQDLEKDLVDPSIVGREGLDEGRVKEFFRIAFLCTREYSKERPAMGEVLRLLTTAFG